MTIENTMIPSNLPADTAVDFSFTCNTCGSTVHVEACTQIPHRCRIELSR